MSAPVEPLTGDAMAFALGATVLSYPDIAYGARVRGLLETPELAPLAPRFAAFARTVDDPLALDDLRSEYIERFDRGALSVLYEAEYGRTRSANKTHTLADLSGFYQAFGFELGEETGHETPDFLAIELEFYALLLMKQAALAAQGDAEGVEVVQTARRKFLDEHLGGFVRGLAHRPEAGGSFAEAVALCLSLVEAHCAALGINPEAAVAGGAAAQAEAEEMKCGSCALTQALQ